MNFDEPTLWAFGRLFVCSVVELHLNLVGNEISHTLQLCTFCWTRVASVGIGPNLNGVRFVVREKIGSDWSVA